MGYCFVALAATRFGFPAVKRAFTAEGADIVIASLERWLSALERRPWAWWFFCSVCSMGLCAFMSRSDWPLLPVLTGAVLLWPRLKLRILLITGLLAFCFRLLFSISFIDFSYTGVTYPLGWSSAAVWLIVLLGEALLLTLGIVFFTRRLPPKFFWLVVAANSIGAFFLVLVCGASGGAESPTDGWQFVNLALKIFLLLSPCALLTLITLPRADRSYWSVLASVCQGWAFGSKHPFAGLARWESREAYTRDELIRTQRKGLRLLFVAGVAMLVKRVIFSLFLGEQALANMTPVIELLQRLHEGQLTPLFVAWRLVLFDWFLFFFRSGLWAATVIGIMRLAGFDLFRHTWRPLEARDFSDFFQRQLYYFNDFIFSVAFWPAFVALRVKYARLRVLISLLLSVGLFNAIVATGYRFESIHRLQVIKASFNQFSLDYLTSFACYLTYSVMLALALYPSVWARLKRSSLPSQQPPFPKAERQSSAWFSQAARLIRVGAFVLFWAAIRTFEYSLPGQYALNWQLLGALLGWPR